MITNTRYIVIYKDGPRPSIRYYGPFVSDTLANEFMDDLPTPMRGGTKVVKQLSHRNHDEVQLAKQDILRHRDVTLSSELFMSVA